MSAKRPPDDGPDEEGSQEALIGQIVAAAAALGWNISVPDTADDVPVPGLCIGTDAYVEFITDALEAFDRRPPWKPPGS